MADMNGKVHDSLFYLFYLFCMPYMNSNQVHDTDESHHNIWSINYVA